MFISTIFYYLLWAVGLVFCITMLLDAIKRDFQKENEKIIWIVLIAVTWIIGALLYYFMIKKKSENLNI